MLHKLYDHVLIDVHNRTHVRLMRTKLMVQPMYVLFVSLMFMTHQTHVYVHCVTWWSTTTNIVYANGVAGTITL
jgi:hypothetical protein